ncbi:MAG: hypothetical protein JWP75_209 [Frondihabitans sp.]|nr:hypothetical protein [Frondihabitans sp.]
MKLSLSPLLVGGAIVALVAGVAAAPVPPPVDAFRAVTRATPSALADSAEVATSVSGANAIRATIDGTNIAVPTDPTSGVKLGSLGSSIRVPVAGFPPAVGAWWPTFPNC